MGGVGGGDRPLLFYAALCLACFVVLIFRGRGRPVDDSPPESIQQQKTQSITTTQPILGTTRVERIHSQSGPALALPFTDQDYEALAVAVAK